MSRNSQCPFTYLIARLQPLLYKHGENQKYLIRFNWVNNFSQEKYQKYLMSAQYSPMISSEPPSAFCLQFLLGKRVTADKRPASVWGC